LEWIDKNKEIANSDNIISFFPVDYEMLSPDYKRLFSEEEFNNISAGEDIYETFLKINSLSPLLIDTEGDISTDGWKNHLYGTLHANNKSYQIQYHILLRAKHFSFKPEIVLWTIDINELPAAAPGNAEIPISPTEDNTDDSRYFAEEVYNAMSQPAAVIRSH
jgi:hypothetical protein